MKQKHIFRDIIILIKPDKLFFFEIPIYNFSFSKFGEGQYCDQTRIETQPRFSKVFFKNLLSTSPNCGLKPSQHFTHKDVGFQSSQNASNFMAEKNDQFTRLFFISQKNKSVNFSHSPPKAKIVGIRPSSI